jgi:hypothetical protein
MKLLNLTVRAAALAGLAATVPAHAQPKPFDLNTDRISVQSASALAASKTYCVPTVYLYISALGDVWAQSRSFFGGANAQAHGKFYVKGLDKAELQGLARQVQDDLVAKLRAAGQTVLTYEDLKSHPELAGNTPQANEKPWDMPTQSPRGPLTYVVATPGDAQNLSYGALTGTVFWLRGMAKERGCVVLVPEIYYSVPQMFGQASSGGARSEAGVSLDPAMKLESALVRTVGPKGEATAIIVQTHGTRLAAQVAGKISKLDEDTTNFSASWKRTSADFMFTLDPPAFNEGVLRVGFALNAFVAGQVSKAQN